MGEIQGVLRCWSTTSKSAGTGRRQYDGHWLVLGSEPRQPTETSMRISAIEAERRGSPYGSMAFLSVVVPNRIMMAIAALGKSSDARHELPVYDTDGAPVGLQFRATRPGS